MSGASPGASTEPSEAGYIQNIETVLALRMREEARVGKHQRLIERATHLLGRPLTIYIELLAVAAWMTVNVEAPKLGIDAFDPPPFNWLQGMLGLGALLITTMVLTTQNRQGRRAEQRSHLDLQVNLLAEQKIAKLVSLLEELRRDLPNVGNRRDSVAEAMTHAVNPHEVATVLEESLNSAHPPQVRDSEPTHG